MIVRCIRCGRQLDDVGQFCSDCRAAVGGGLERPDPAAMLASGNLPCQRCGALVAAGSSFCSACGLPVAGVPLKYAGFWIRFVAWIVDAVILGAVGGVLFVAIEDPVARGALNFVISFIYTVGFWTLEGATPGKMAIGARILTTDGQEIAFRHALLRYIGTFVSAVIFLIGFIMIAFNNEKRGLHDYIAGTVVVLR